MTNTPEAIFGVSPYLTREIHLLSVDTEGNEAEILRAIDHKNRLIHVVDVECNSEDNLPPLREALPDYAFVARFHFDAFFINRRSPFLRRAEALRRAMGWWTVKRRAEGLIPAVWRRRSI